LSETLNAAPPRWTREQVEHLLATETFRYHRIELGYGLATEGRDRSNTARQIFPDDLTGKSVLDLGCSEGALCFEAARRNASRVVGLDVEPDTIRKNKLKADCLGLDVEFGTIDLERDALSEKFDYVMCLNVLHHLTNPLSVLNSLIEIADERMILEMASLGPHDRRRLGILPVFGYFLSKAPIIYVGKTPTRGRKLKRFFITPGAIHNILVHHRRVYARVDIERSEHKDRFIATAHRRKIDHLIVVAGPVGIGLETICRNIADGKYPQVAERIGAPSEGRNITVLNPMPENSTEDPKIGTAVMGYDIMRSFMRTGNVYTRDDNLDVLACARKITFVTAWTDAETLRRQLHDSKFAYGTFKRPNKREKRIYASYDNPSEIAGHYDGWFDYVTTRKDDQFVLDLSGEQGAVIDQKAWQKKVAGLRK
jgi:SAM-dependent methyltransferase